jgi:hypothetical protein
MSGEQFLYFLFNRKNKIPKKTSREIGCAYVCLGDSTAWDGASFAVSASALGVSAMVLVAVEVRGLPVVVDVGFVAEYTVVCSFEKTIAFVRSLWLKVEGCELWLMSWVLSNSSRVLVIATVLVAVNCSYGAMAEVEPSAALNV